MTKTLLRAGALACALMTSTCLTPAPAAAQMTAPAPVRQTVDGNGVDLFRGTVSIDAPALTLGQGWQGLSYRRLNRGSGWADNMTATLQSISGGMLVRLGGTTDSFTLSGGVYTPTEGNGASLSYNGTTKIYTYTASDGTIVRFDENRGSGAPFYADKGRATEIVRPDGSRLVFSYEHITYCAVPNSNGTSCQLEGRAYRATSVRNSFGYRLNFAYPEFFWEYDRFNPYDVPDFAEYARIVAVTGENLAAPTGTGGPGQSFAETATELTVTDAMNRTTSFRMSSGRALGITLPGSSSEDVTYTLANGTSGRVTAVATPAGTTTYASSDANGVRTVTVTDALSNATVYKFDIATERLKSVTDANNSETQWSYVNNRLDRITRPEGNYTSFLYDARGNLTETRQVAKSGSGLADIVETAAYPSTCTNPLTCNQPTSVTDARGNTTDFTYDSNHGGVLTVTLPAPASGATRPQLRQNYSQLQAYFRNSAGSIVASGEPVTLPTGTSACASGTAPSCVGTDEESVTAIGYGPQTAGTGNNLLPVSSTTAAGDGSPTATTAMAYDHVGNLVSADGPLSGADDTVRFRYNANRERIGAVGPDPDGAGTMQRRAERATVASTGLVTKVERGTVAGTSDTDWAGFSSLEAVETSHDAARRPVVTRLTAGGTTYALTQTSYDAAGRPQCVAVRMNPAEFGSLPTDACTLDTEGSGANAFGPDRITRTTYDDGGRPTLVQTGYLVSGVQADEVATTYRANGQAETVTDAEGNRTTYVFDGHDRLSRTRFPSPTTDGVSSTTDYEELTYDAGGNVTNRRLRDAQNIAFTYDALNRPTLKNLPGSEPDVSYVYDLLGRLTSASQTGHALSFGYDALGRQLTQTSPQGTITSEFDLAGRRTRITHPGGFYVDQDYLVTGEMWRIRENGATTGVGVLATFDYDNLGRRISLTRGNGTTASYSYDAVSRLSQLIDNPLNATHDQTLGFTYNPASQIASNTRSNDLFAFAPPLATQTTPVNGLNQLTSVTGTSVAHDLRGNMTAESGRSYGYTSENLLGSMTYAGTTTLAYDPLMRLHQLVGWSGPKFTYDGMNLTLETHPTTGAVQRRFVHGPGVDEPLVQYEGSGTTDRRFLHADERGSIVAHSDGTGAVTAVNRYDEYGQPHGPSGAGTLAGRFGYTGQVWLPELGLWYYRARMYNARIGRFIQTDPIGYWGGMNLYAYVGGDPVNFSDPSGTLREGCIYVTGRLNPVCGEQALRALSELGLFREDTWEHRYSVGPEGRTDLGTRLISSRLISAFPVTLASWQENPLLDRNNPDSPLHVFTPEGASQAVVNAGRQSATQGARNVRDFIVNCYRGAGTLSIMDILGSIVSGGGRAAYTARQSGTQGAAVAAVIGAAKSGVRSTFVQACRNGN